MKVLIQHIEMLLPDHDCVVVPGLGGFVQNEVSSRYDSEADLFYPVGKEIGFNSRLTFNDGFLAQAYQESFDISFEESNLQIRQGVQEIKDKIDEGKYVSLGRIGVIWKNEKGQIFFRSENKNYFFPQSYGLTSFSYPSLDKRQKRTAHAESIPLKRKEAEFINIRLRRNSFNNFVTGAVACLFLLLLSKPAGNLPDSKNQEAFMMHDYIVSSETPKVEEPEALTILEEPAVKQEEEKPAVTVTVNQTAKSVVADKKDDIIKEPLFTEVKDKVERKEINEIKTPSVSDHTYYIVISSFPEKKQAEDWIQSKGRSATLRLSGIIEKDGRSRVYARSFPDKKEAQAFLNNFRAKNAEYASAWLLSTKNN